MVDLLANLQSAKSINMIDGCGTVVYSYQFQCNPGILHRSNGVTRDATDSNERPARRGTKSSLKAATPLL